MISKDWVLTNTLTIKLWKLNSYSLIGTNRVLDNCISTSTTTRANINSMATNEINSKSVADVTSCEAPIASSSRVWDGYELIFVSKLISTH